jgi:hypothetical protein
MATYIESTISRLLTLASSATVYNLHTLLQAINPNYPKMVKSLRIMMQANGSDGTVYIGDATMTGGSDTGYAVTRNATDNFLNEFSLDGSFMNIDLSAFNLRPAANNLTIQVFAKVE